MEIVYNILYHPLVSKQDIPKLSNANKLLIKRSIEKKLRTHPDLYGIPLRRSLKGYRKLRIKNYRVIYRIEKETIYILAIIHRSVVYKLSKTRN